MIGETHVMIIHTHITYVINYEVGSEYDQLLAARDKILQTLGRTALPKPVTYGSDQTHSALQKACQIGGIDPQLCRLLKTDSSTNFALAPDVLSEATSNDIASGLLPFFLCTNVGTTSSTAVDPLPALAKVTRTNNIWFHVDAAYAGSACICPEYRHFIDGVEEVDSFNMNAHKWFLTNFDCSLLWVKAEAAAAAGESNFRSFRVVVQRSGSNVAIIQQYFTNSISRFLLPVDGAHAAACEEMATTMSSAEAAAYKGLQ